MTRNINDLPKEVLMSIFSFLSGKELAMLSLVSKYFKLVQELDYLWNSLYEARFKNQELTSIIEMEDSSKCKFIKKYYVDTSFRRQLFSKIQFPTTKQIFSIEPFNESVPYENDFFVCTGECVHLYTYKCGGEKIIRDIFLEDVEGVHDSKLVFDCAYLSKHEKLVCCGSTEFVEVWDIRTKKLENKMNLERKGIWSCEGFSDNFVCVSTSEGKVKVLDIQKQSEKLIEFSPCRDLDQISRVPMFDCTSVPNNPNLLISASDHLYLWDIRNHQKKHKSNSSSISYSVPEIDLKFRTRVYEVTAFQNIITCGLLNGYIFQFDIRKLSMDNCLSEFQVSNEAVKGIQFDGDKLVVGTKRGWVCFSPGNNESLQFNTQWLVFRVKKNSLNLKPVSGISLKNGVSVGCLYFNDCGCFVGENSDRGNLSVYDSFYGIKKESKKCLIQ